MRERQTVSSSTYQDFPCHLLWSHDLSSDKYCLTFCFSEHLDSKWIQIAVRADDNNVFFLFCGACRAPYMAVTVLQQTHSGCCLQWTVSCRGSAHRVLLLHCTSRQIHECLIVWLNILPEHEHTSQCKSHLFRLTWSVKFEQCWQNTKSECWMNELLLCVFVCLWSGSYYPPTSFLRLQLHTVLL